MAKKETTIDELAIMVKRGFDGMDRRLDETAKRAEVNKRFDKIENILIKQHDEKLAELERRIRTLEEALAV